MTKPFPEVEVVLTGLVRMAARMTRARMVHSSADSYRESVVPHPIDVLGGTI